MKNREHVTEFWILVQTVIGWCCCLPGELFYQIC